MDTTASADDTLFANVQGFDYFAIVESDPAIQAWMAAHTGLAGDIGVYAVKDTFHSTEVSAPTP